MKALCWHGHGDVRIDTVPDPSFRSRPTSSSRSRRLRFAAPICIFSTATCRPWKRRHPRSRANGRGRRGRQRDQEAEEGRSRRGAVHHLLRRMLLLQEDAVLAAAIRTNPNAEIAAKAMGHSPAGLFGYSHMLGGYRRRPGGVSARAVRRRRAAQDRVRSARREGALSLRHFSHRLHGGRELRHRKGRHCRRLGLRPGRAVRDPERLDVRRGARNRHRSRARAAGDGARAAARPRSSTSARTTRSTSSCRR